MLRGRIFGEQVSCSKKTQALRFLIRFSAQYGSKTVLFNTEEIDDTREFNSKDDFAYADVPRSGPKWKRKPYVTPMKVLIRRAKEEKKARKENPCRVLEHAPENGLLVPHLIEVAHQVYNARKSLLHGLSKLVDGEKAIPIQKCWYAANSS